MGRLVRHSNERLRLPALHDENAYKIVSTQPPLSETNDLRTFLMSSSLSIALYADTSQCTERSQSVPSVVSSLISSAGLPPGPLHYNITSLRDTSSLRGNIVAPEA
jgi:hypothetical protein